MLLNWNHNFGQWVYSLTRLMQESDGTLHTKSRVREREKLNFFPCSKESWAFSFECMCLMGLDVIVLFQITDTTTVNLYEPCLFYALQQVLLHTFVYAIKVYGWTFKGNSEHATAMLCILECMLCNCIGFFMDGRGSMTFEISSDTFCSRLLSAENLCLYGIARDWSVRMNSVTITINAHVDGEMAF